MRKTLRIIGCSFSVSRPTISGIGVRLPEISLRIRPSAQHGVCRRHSAPQILPRWTVRAPHMSRTPSPNRSALTFRLLPSFHAVDPLSVLFFDNNRLMKMRRARAAHGRSAAAADHPVRACTRNHRRLRAQSIFASSVISSQSRGVCTRNHCRSAVRAERYRLCVLRRSNFIKSEQGRRHGFEQHDRRLPF